MVARRSSESCRSVTTIVVSAVVCTASAKRNARNGFRASPKRMPHAVSRFAVDGGERRHARIVDRGDGRRRVVDRRHRERQPPRRLTAFHELGFDLGQQESVGAARERAPGRLSSCTTSRPS